MTERLKQPMLRRIFTIAMLDAAAVTYLAGVVSYALVVMATPSAKPFINAAHFLLTPAVASVVVAVLVLVILAVVRSASAAKSRVDRALRRAMRRAARLPVMLGLAGLMTGCALLAASTSMSSLTRSDWSGTPPSAVIDIALVILAGLFMFAGGPLACYLGLRLTREFRNEIARLIQDCCPTCGYDLTGLEAGAVCPECGEATTETPV